MGNWLFKCCPCGSSSPSVSIAMVGLDGAGKSTLIQKWKTGQLVKLRPTVGFNMETVFYRDISFTILDISGQPKCRPTWSQYLALKQAIIYVVDASDHVRIGEACVALHRLIASSEKEHAKTPLFIIGTKMDQTNVLDEITFRRMMKLSLISATRKWHFQMVNLMAEKDLYECFDWLIVQLKKRKVI